MPLLFLSMNAIEIKNLTVSFDITDSENSVISEKKVLDDISLSVKEGEFISILGKNGSGKSTFAKCLNALMLPSEGDVLIFGLNTRDDEHTMQIRQTVGMTFQNPDNQIVASIVEEDIAFGLENLGVESSEIRKRVDEIIDKLGIKELKKAMISKLSGGQKQKISIAGILTMRPKIIVLDEPTSMIDKAGRIEILKLAKTLNETRGITVVLISHYLEEIAYADRVILFNAGKIDFDGLPSELLLHSDILINAGLDMPYIPKLATNLMKQGKKVKGNEMTVEDLCRFLK